MATEAAAKQPEPAAKQPETTAKQPEAAKPVVEKQTNCPVCSKPIKKLRRYYRNGIFYCTKRCWMKSVKEKKEPKDDKK